MEKTVELVIDYPSNIASALLKDEIDVGLVPVAIIPEMKNHYIISDYGITSDGEVASVCLFSEVPVEDIKVVLLDYQSRTSVELIQILLTEYWKINPVFQTAELDFQQKISGSTAAVVIGDRAFEQRTVSKYSYDLGTAWKQLTGLPFVFAAWVSNKPLGNEFIQNFNEAIAFGLNHIDEVVKQNPFPLFNLQEYFTRFIRYGLTTANRRGLKMFLQKVGERSGKQIPFF
ncbi:MAG: menaquinone biosynthesis protein [Ferruginibacter sp.]|nr:menaquinone biosynthesis protein [Ferruginibacter sp.]